MTSEEAGVRKNHPPRKFRDPAIELTINKIPDPSQTKTDRRGHNHPVCNSQKWQSLAFAEPPPGNRGADQAAVKRHAPMPDGDDFQRIANKIRQVHVLVEKNVSQPGSGDESDGKVEHEILNQA